MVVPTLIFKLMGQDFNLQLRLLLPLKQDAKNWFETIREEQDAKNWFEAIREVGISEYMH